MQIISILIMILVFVGSPAYLIYYIYTKWDIVKKDGIVAVYRNAHPTFFIPNLITILMIFLGGLAAMDSVGVFSLSTNSSGKFDLSDSEACRNFIQGKWHYTHHTGSTSNNIHFRLEITGNQVKIWNKRGSEDWKMGSPDEVNSISIGSLTRSVDNIPCRYISWNRISLKANLIGSNLILYDNALCDGTGLRVIYRGWK